MAEPVLRVPDFSHGPFPERTTRVVTCTVRDENAAAIPGASLTSIVYTLYSEHTLAILNSRADVDCKPNVDANGVLTLQLTPADMGMEDTTRQQERHRLLIEWVYSTGKEGRAEIQILVANLALVP
jgi:hypothetical protein